MSLPSSNAHATMRRRQWTGEEEFLIIASDGLWDGLTFDQAVHLVRDTRLARLNSYPPF